MDESVWFQIAAWRAQPTLLKIRIMNDLRDRISEGVADFTNDLEALLAMPVIKLGDASLPDASGVYMLLVGDELMYVGEAKGSQGLRDRVLSKHISGDDNHAIQRAFRDQFPDRKERRAYIRQHVSVRWVVIHDPTRVSVVERLAIWLFCPPWNRK
jgi:hypothetical protein